MSRAPIVCVLLIVAVFVGVLMMQDPATSVPTWASATAAAAAHTSAAAAAAQAYEAKVAAWQKATAVPEATQGPARQIQVRPEESTMASLAWARATLEVQSLLKTPSVAQFPLETVRFAKKGDMTWVVQGYVDTQNSFGAMIRESYQATIRFHGSLANVYNPDWWIPEALQIGTRHYGYHNPYKPEIIEAQRRLTALGYKTGGADGIVGPATQAALSAFLADHELPPVTGDLTTALLDAVPAMQRSTP